MNTDYYGNPMTDEELDKNKPVFRPETMQVKPEFNRSSKMATKIIDQAVKPTFSSTGLEQPPILRSGEMAAFGSRLQDPANLFSGQVVTPITTNNPTLGKSFQMNNFDVQRPTFGKSGLDLNGDGIPDGASVERVVQHQGPNGEQIKDKFSWNKAPIVVPTFANSAYDVYAIVGKPSSSTFRDVDSLGLVEGDLFLFDSGAASNVSPRLSANITPDNADAPCNLLGGDEGLFGASLSYTSYWIWKWTFSFDS